MNIQLFGLEICIVYNKYMGAATFAPIDEGLIDKRKETQLLATRYFFSQFWCEFTAAIMKEFHEDDVVYRQSQMEQVNKLKKLTGLSETERKIETAKIVKNKSSVFQKDEMTKRNFYL
jgi:hypothetical protein